MAEQNPENIQTKGEVTDEEVAGVVVANPTVTPEPEQVPDGDAQTPPKPPEKEEPSKDEVQRRIDKMYARLQQEKEKRLSAEAQRDAQALLQKSKDTDEDEIPAVQTTAKEEVERILRQKRLEESFEMNEKNVLVRHPNAVDENGNFNMDDPFVQAYIRVGKENPGLVYMVNGPLLAEAQAEKELGILYDKGRKDEATRRVASSNAHTVSSTTAPSPAVRLKLSDQEKTAAARAGMTEKEWVNYRDNTTIEYKRRA